MGPQTLHVEHPLLCEFHYWLAQIFHKKWLIFNLKYFWQFISEIFTDFRCLFELNFFKILSLLKIKTKLLEYLDKYMPEYKFYDYYFSVRIIRFVKNYFLGFPWSGFYYYHCSIRIPIMLNPLNTLFIFYCMCLMSHKIHLSVNWFSM